MDSNDISIEAVSKLNRDLRNSAKTLDTHQVRYLVDLYYQVQDYRIRAAHQLKQSSDQGEPNALLAWASENFQVLERGIQSSMDVYSTSSRVGRWLRSIHGVGPILSAGYLAHLSVYPWKCVKAKPGVKACQPEAPCTPACAHKKINTAGAFWRFAGLDPTLKWNKGEKRPWNASLKVLLWKQADVWVRLRSNDKDFYGRLYEQRKAYEEARDERGGNATAAAETLSSKKIRDPGTLETYESGHLPKGRLDLRARRWAAKLFLAHLHHVMFEDKFGEAPPRPYVIDHLGHVDIIGPPGWPCE